VLAKNNRLRRSRFFETDEIVFPKVIAFKSCRASRRESCVLNFNEFRQQAGAAKVARETETRSKGYVAALRVLRVARKIQRNFCERWRGGKSSRLKRKLKFCKVCRAPRFEASVLKIKLTAGKVGRGGNQDTPNKSLDVRAKQRLCLGVVR